MCYGSDMELPYIAGLFDGEGTVVITKPTPTEPRRHQLRAAVCMTHEPTIRALHASVGSGSVKRVDAARYNPNASTRYDWVVVAASAAAFLRDIRPWLRTKAEAVDLGLEFALTTGVRGVPINDSVFTRRESLRLQLAEVNRNGGQH